MVGDWRRDWLDHRVTQFGGCTMNPFGLFDAVVTAVELVLHTSRRKSGKESRRNRVLFWFAYGFLLAAGIGAAVWVIRSLYF